MINYTPWQLYTLQRTITEELEGIALKRLQDGHLPEEVEDELRNYLHQRCEALEGKINILKLLKSLQT